MGKFIRALAVFTFVLVTATTISFAVPQLINYQGTLSDGSGNPVNGDVNITFTIYNAPAGGDVLWTETQTVTVTDGAFNVVLGSQSPILSNTFDGDERYLGVLVGADPEMAPRQALVSVPFAHRSACIPGDFLNCYTADPGTLNVGDCDSGLRTCQPEGTWGDCVGETTPVTEVCYDAIDNNCDGQVDEGCGPPDGTLCDDDNECTVGDEYNGGVCAGIPAVGTSCNDFTPGDCAMAQCDDTGQCVQDYAFEPPTTECRASAGLCDIAEFCTGSSAACPVDNFASPATECRASNGPCDVAETCTGSSTVCPADNFASPITECRASAGYCDIAEFCDGTNAACPSDVFVSPGTECRAAQPGGCDIAEFCDGTNAACPSDVFVSPGTECRAAQPGGCDIAEVCTGSSAACPIDTFEPSTTECRTAVPGGCDIAEFCDGYTADCPADYFEPFGTSCGTDLICDGAGLCIPL